MKTTKATIKSFIKRNEGSLYIRVLSTFDGMTDCCQPVSGGFRKAEKDQDNERNTLGISGAWFVGHSRDYFTNFENEAMTGYEISNSCGSFILAVFKTNNYMSKGFCTPETTKRKFRVLIAIAGILLLSGCATSFPVREPQYQIPTGYPDDRSLTWNQF